MAARRAAKCQSAPAPAPRILNLPRRPGGRPGRGSGRGSRPADAAGDARNLGALFALERRVRGLESAPASPPHSRAHSQGDDPGEQEERWQFQAEILRAECNFLRMEREVALRKLDRHRGRMEAALKSAVETLVSGRKKIDGRGEAGVAAALEEEIGDLEEMMEELTAEKESGRGWTGGAGGGLRELQRSHGKNFDRQASSLRRRLEKMSANTEPCVKEIREIALPVVVPPPHHPPTEHSDNDDADHSAQFSDVEMLRRKMEGMSKGMRERMAEYTRRLQAVAAGDDAAANVDCQPRKCGNGHRRRTSTGSQRSCGSAGSHAALAAMAVADSNSLHGRSRQGVAAEKHPHKFMAEECKLARSGSCSDCREIVGKIMEQVRAESEQWTEMQDMLEQVRLEMQELQASSDTWQRRAIASDKTVRSLNAQMLEWKHRAQVSEQNVQELEKQVSELQSKLHTFKAHFLTPKPTQEQPEARKMEVPRTKAQHNRNRSLECVKEKEKHVLICRVKNSPDKFLRRSPLQDIGNLSSLRQ